MTVVLTLSDVAYHVTLTFDDHVTSNDCNTTTCNRYNMKIAANKPIAWLTPIMTPHGSICSISTFQFIDLANLGDLVTDLPEK